MTLKGQVRAVFLVGNIIVIVVFNMKLLSFSPTTAVGFGPPLLFLVI